MIAPRILRQLKINDVSSVDVGAGRGVKVVLTKRHAEPIDKHQDGVSTLYNKPIVFGHELPQDALDYLKREFSQAERDSAASSGAALPDGSFPIHNKSDLKNAIQAIGRAKNPAKAKAHIRSRARALGATDMLPDSWSKRATAAEVAKFVKGRVEAGIAKGAVDFDDAYDMIESAEDAGALMHEVREACCALDCSIRSILEDEEIGDKAKAIADSLEQFQEHISGLEVSEHDDDEDDDMEKAMSTGTITPALQKMIDDAAAAAVAKVASEKDAIIAKQARDIEIAKMSEKHKAYHSSLDEDAKKKFEAMSPADRDSEMEKTKKRAEDDPIYKSMRVENEDLRKRLTAIEDERALDIAKRDAKELGMTATNAGEVLMKARRGDMDAMKELEKHMSTLAKAKAEVEKTGKIFQEFGTAHVAKGDGSATDELVAKAADLRKAKPDLTPEQAFDKVYTDPANRELVDRERTERMSKIHRVA